MEPKEEPLDDLSLMPSKKLSTQFPVHSIASPYQVCTVSFGESSAVVPSYSSLMEPKEEPLNDLSLMPTENEIANASFLKEPKEEPIKLFLLENEMFPQQNFMEDNAFKQEEMIEDGKISSSSPQFPLETKDEPIDVSEAIHHYEQASIRFPVHSSVSPYPVCTVSFGDSSINASETAEVDNLYPISLKRSESMENSDINSGPLMKKTRSDSEKATPQCVLCEAYPSTACGYIGHLYGHHKSNLKSNGIYLLCSCGKQFRSSTATTIPHEKCDGLRFSLHRLEQTIHSTPQCILCEKFPSTASAYAYHLYEHHKSTLKLNEIYLLCSCGKEVRSSNIDVNHSKKCDGLLFSLHKDEQKIRTTPQCVMCEAFPSTACGYAAHMKNNHKSALNANGIYLVCSCGKEYHSQANRNHSKTCDGREFSLHKLDDK